MYSRIKYTRFDVKVNCTKVTYKLKVNFADLSTEIAVSSSKSTLKVGCLNSYAFSSFHFLSLCSDRMDLRFWVVLCDNIQYFNLLYFVRVDHNLVDKLWQYGSATFPRLRTFWINYYLRIIKLTEMIEDLELCMTIHFDQVMASVIYECFHRCRRQSPLKVSCRLLNAFGPRRRK